MKLTATSRRVSAYKQTFPSVIARNPSTEFALSEAEGLRINSVTKQSDTECHSERSEESQTDRFAGIWGGDQEGGMSGNRSARDDSGNTVGTIQYLQS